MSELGDKQKKFPLLIAQLIIFAYAKGYELSWGDGYRDSRVFGEVGTKKGYGRSKSNHKIRLAQDLNLFKDGTWLTETHDHAILGKYWESLDEDCRWGGHYNDGNHYSMIYRGTQ